MKDFKIEMVEALSNANGISGFEDDVLTVARRFAEKSIQIEEDKLRNLYLRHSKNRGDRPLVMVDGHSDEVGFMVQSVAKNGTLRFVPMGGWMAQVAMGQKVQVVNQQGDIVSGVIGAKPPHFVKPEEKGKLVEMDQMFIDVGASSKEEAESKFGIAPGAPVVPDVRFSLDEGKGIMMGKAFDCRLGCAAVIQTLNRLEGQILSADVVGTLSAQEEVGLRGAQVSARRIKPDVAVIFEGTPADDIFKEGGQAQAVLKKGPQIRHRDNSMVANPRFVRFAREIAQKKKIPFQDAVRESGGDQRWHGESRRPGGYRSWCWAFRYGISMHPMASLRYRISNGRWTGHVR